ncbi:MAG: hypothetical protein QOD30_1141, partial [Actinomycetota bacterium]|nr:hypothetical protein [Actinomycetota bacterium]
AGAAPTIAEGTVVALGDATPIVGSPSVEDLVALASSPTGAGWWATSSEGVVRVAGDAVDAGGVPSTTRLNRPIVGMAAPPTGGGYWLVASDGGIFTFGDAPFAGSTGAIRLNEPIVGMAATRSGRGYWLVASDGGVFAFGDARPFGSLGGSPQSAPITAMAATPSGRGYRLLRSDGAVADFGDAVDRGSIVGRVPDAAAVALVTTPTGDGYRVGVGALRDRVVIWQPGGLDASSQRWALDVASRAGARATVRHSSTVDLPAANGWRIPLSMSAIEPGPGAPIIGPSASAALARGEIVLGRDAAALRNATVGSTVQLLGDNDVVQAKRVGAVVPDRRVGAEVALSIDAARAMGEARPLSVSIWGVPRGDLDQALASAPPMPTRLGVDRSWSPPDPDDVLSSVGVKRVVGEVAYRPGRGDAVTLDPSWVGRNIASERMPGLGTVVCARAILAPLRGALTEVVRAGLGGGLGRYGGCYAPRLIRGGDSGGALSRHSFGMAVDVNITNNSFGGRVSMDPRIVAIFRRWGFAWGGTWVRPDGMHFEYHG